MTQNNIIYLKHDAASIIDAFESFLDKKGIVIPNEERDNDEDLEDGANIYGDDFDELESNIIPILEKLASEAHLADGYNSEAYNDHTESNKLFKPFIIKD